MSTVNYDQSYRTTGGLQRFDCLAWVNFNGTGTVAIRASGNVSSITDNGVGNYTINFTNPLPDADYAPVFTAGNAGWAVAANNFFGALSIPTTRTASACRFVAAFVDTSGIGQAFDPSDCNALFFR